MEQDNTNEQELLNDFVDAEQWQNELFKIKQQKRRDGVLWSV